jgi:Tol biopolymer transport system component
VGLHNENAVLIGGQTNFIKSQVEIPYTGSAVDFKRELSVGIARVMLIEMMFGGSLKDMVQSAYLLTLPEWFISGAASYVAEGWSLEMDNYMRDAVAHKNMRRPSVLSGQDATLVGHSIWNFIAERYGRANISNILNLTRIIRNEESSIGSTLGIPYSRFLGEWRSFYTNLNAPVSSSLVQPDETFRARRNSRNRFSYHQVRISPNGKNIAYSENKGGKYKLFVRSTNGRQTKWITSGGYKVINQRFDPGLPLVNWRNNNQLMVIHVSEGKYMLSTYDVTKTFGRRTSRRPLGNLDHIQSFDVSEDGRTLVLSATRNGQNDLFFYEVGRGAITALTNDLFDDLHPQFVPGGNRALVFSSNRTTDSLNTDKGTYATVNERFDLFAYDPAQESKVLRRIVATPGNALQPRVVNENTVFYLNDATGIRQLYRYDRQTGSNRQVSNFRQNIDAYDVYPADSSLAFLTLNNRRRYVAYKRAFNLAGNYPSVYTRRSKLLEERGEISLDSQTQPQNNGAVAPGDSLTPTPPAPSQLTLREGEVDTDNYQFDSGSRPRQPDATPQTPGGATVAGGPGAKKPGNIPISGPFTYESRFATNNIVSTALIDPLRGLGILFNLSMNDALENHRVNGGLLGFVDLQSSNFFGEYQYLKHRVDFGLRFDKKTYFFNYLNSEGFAQRYNLYRFQPTFSYPISVASRITLAPTFMITRYVETGHSNNNAIITPINVSHYGGIKAEYVFDNTIINGLNMIEGTRMKIRYENYRGITSADESFNNLHIDLRNYKKVHRDIIFATRLAFGNFGGRRRKSYMLGGMDNWIFNTKDRRNTADSPIRTVSQFDNRDILFNEFVTNLRGFNFNKLSGNTYLLFNGELRFPIVKYFYRGPITSNFFKNFQFVGFADVGAAWTGRGPFSRQNSLNTVLIGGGNNPFRATVTNFKNPFLAGYGLGARTLLLGYYVKFDVAWGVEDYVVTSPKYYLTLGYDF